MKISLIKNIVKLAVGVIFLQTLFFKFSGAEESVYIFSKLGVEPWGRIGTGFVELIIVLMLLIPRIVWLGATLGLFAMLGAILAHFFSIGIEVSQDNGLLFCLAIINFIGCSFLMYNEREMMWKIWEQ
ncbi:DoxX family protein [Leptospira levettii]|uniref:DoxX family protein n=1 Tax=Leptospira levettii TaxID=2023178 RepID=UPI000C2AB80C|nr:DoxX family protein [Leptospira levettii]PKA00315.1 DoxX family protein [Leptospira levettii]TGK98132.1 DoxX family protein [Leptospira levettii]TGL09252.1 DoxX family protein [Leptospira levettii]